MLVNFEFSKNVILCYCVSQCRVTDKFLNKKFKKTTHGLQFLGDIQKRQKTNFDAESVSAHTVSQHWVFLHFFGRLRNVLYFKSYWYFILSWPLKKSNPRGWECNPEKKELLKQYFITTRFFSNDTCKRLNNYCIADSLKAWRIIMCIITRKYQCCSQESL